MEAPKRCWFGAVSDQEAEERASHLAAQRRLVATEAARCASALGQYLGRADLFTCVYP
jgi:hypothetical protein